jgi:peroxidase
VNRLYNFGGTGKPDPTLNTAYLAQLQSLCPNVQGGTNNVALDLNSEFSFDTSYYRNIQANKGLLRIDQEIGNDARTSGTVNTLAASSNAFGNEFGTAVVAMGRIGVLTSGKVRAMHRVTCLTFSRE